MSCSLQLLLCQAGLGELPSLYFILYPGGPRRASLFIFYTFYFFQAGLGELPFLPEGAEVAEGAVAPQPRAEGRPVVLADGSYASQATDIGIVKRWWRW